MHTKEIQNYAYLSKQSYNRRKKYRSFFGKAKKLTRFLLLYFVFIDFVYGKRI